MGEVVDALYRMAQEMAGRLDQTTRDELIQYVDERDRLIVELKSMKVDPEKLNREEKNKLADILEWDKAVSNRMLFFQKERIQQMISVSKLLKKPDQFYQGNKIAGSYFIDQKQ